MTTRTLVELRKPTLSPTALSEYEICGRRGQFYHDPDLPRVSTMSLAIGGGWHKAMETYALARIQLGDEEVGAISPYLLQERLYDIAMGVVLEVTAQENFEWQEDDSIETVSSQMWAMLATWVNDPGARWMDGSTRPVDVEAQVLVELGSEHHQFHGYLDSVYEFTDQSRDPGPILVDYKTASRAWPHTKAGDGKGDGNPRKLIQAPLYAEAWVRTTGEEVNWFAYDVMTYGGKFERIWVDVCPQMRKPFLRRWLAVSEMIERYGNEPLPTNPGAMLCSKKWCSYWTYCEMGEGLDVALKGRTNNDE